MLVSDYLSEFASSQSPDSRPTRLFCEGLGLRVRPSGRTRSGPVTILR